MTKKISRKEAVTAFHESTKDMEIANQLIGGVFALFIRNFLAYSYAINEVVDRIAEDSKAYRFGTKHVCNHIENEYNRMASLMRTTYNIGYYANQMQDVARYYFDAVKKELEMIRLQVWQVFTKHQETNRMLLSYIYTAMYIADWTQKQWVADTSDVERVLYVNRQFMKVDVHTKSLFNPLKVDSLVHDLKVLAKTFADKSGGVINLNDDPNVKLATRIFLNKLDSQKIIDECIDKAGLLNEKEQYEKD